ncbi:MAG: EamA family transporter [Bacteroidales bacterium 55_9]|nr:MAG: EamA family transporter [Bacteroidales bacterium 55_9]
MNVKVKGYLLGALAAASYGMNPLFALPLYNDGMDPYSVLFFRYLFAIPILGIMLKARGRTFAVSRHDILPLVVMGLLLAMSSLSLFLSYNYMEAGIASTMLFVYPIMVAVIMAIFFREHITAQTASCIFVALVGIALLYKGSDGATLDATGVMWVMVSALSYALYIVGVNRPRLKGIATLKLTFYALVFGFSIFIVCTDFGRALTFPSAWYKWGNLVALALFPTAISFLCTTQAIQYIGSTPTAILGALEPLTAVFFGVTVFGEALTPRLMFGIVMIIAAVSALVAGGSITSHLIRFKKMFPRLRRHPRA